VSAAVHDEIFARCPVEQGDVLYIKDGVTAGLAAINHLREPFSMLSSVALLKPKRDLLEPRYLKHWLNSPTTFARMTGEMTGSAIRRLVLRQIRSAAIPLAPLPEQKRIADKLDILLARVDTCRNHLARVPAILKRFRQSVLAAATSGELTREWREEYRVVETWRQTTLGSIVADVRYGTAKKCAYEPGKTPVIRIPNVVGGTVSHEDMKYADFDEDERDRLALEPGDLLMIRSNGSVGLVGRTALVSEREAGFLYAGYLIRLRVDAAQASPAYLSAYLSSPTSRTRIEITARSTTGVNNINSEEIRALPVELPSLAEQAEIVRRVDSLFTLADQLEARYTAARTHIDRLTPALLAKAFRGELVPQDPGDTRENPTPSDGRVEPLPRQANPERQGR
jgi:type I restriction enzyme S subunit